jgi:hypothetical protein
MASVAQRRNRNLGGLGGIARDIVFVEVVEAVDLVGNAVGITAIAFDRPAVLIEAE